MGKGGGSAPAQPTTQTVQQSNIPEYARPYFEDIMTRGQAVSQTEYQPYTGQRVAEFTPMQQQAFQGIQNLGVSPLVGAGAGMTGIAGLGGLGAGQQYQQMATSPGAIQAYMSPYMQNVVDFQKSQAIQDYARQLPGQQAAATRAGAFGGSRQAIVEAEAQRNLQNQLAGIQAQGTQSAFDAARQAQQFGSQLGLQGLGLAGQMGQQFGQLGQTAFGQQAAAAQAQQQAGAIQQAQEQQKMDLGYEEFMRQQLYPQSQLQFLSSLLRGSVVAPQQTMYTYQQQPSMVSQLGGLGLGALGLSKAFGAKDGGEVPGYAEGGEVERFAEGGLASNVAKLTKFLMASQNPEQDVKRMGGTPIEKYLALQKVQQLRGATQNQQALDRGVPQGTVMDEAGLSGLDAGVMEDVYAGGGIVAFEDGGMPRGQRQFDVTDPFGIYSGLKALYNRPRTYATPAEEERARRLEALMAERAPAVPAAPVGIAAALPATTTPEVAQIAGRPATRPEDFARPGAAPALFQPRPEAPPARAAATAAPAVKPAEDDIAELRKTLEGLGKDLPSREAAEESRRAALRKAIPDDLQERLDSYKAEAAQALKERDQDRWLAVAMGGFAAAAGSSPYALRNFGEGLGLTTKELMSVNKDFRKMEAERQKLMREEQRLARAEKLGIEKEALAAGDARDKRLDAYNKVKADAQSKLAELANRKYGYELEHKGRMAQVAAANRTPAEIQLIERVAKEKGISFSEAMGLVAGTKREPMSRAKAVADWSSNPILQAQYPNVESYVSMVVGGGSGGSSSGTPTPGTVMQGYKFKGGDPSKKENWEKV